MSAALASIATALETAAGASTSTNPNEPGYWSRIAAAAETLAGATTSANAVPSGYMLRAALAFESIAGTSGAEENTNYSGYMKRIVDALEVQSGAVETGSLLHRLTLAAQNATFVSGPTDLLDGLNNNFSAAAPPPTLAAPSGTSTLLITAGKLVYTGGTFGNFMTATWSGLTLVSGGSYLVEYDASGQALGCAPRFDLGAAGVIGGLGTTGTQTLSLTSGAGDTLVISFSPNTAGRNLSLDNVHLYRALADLTLDGGASASIEENVPIGTIVAEIQGTVAGSVITLTDDAGGLFAIDGANLVTAGEIDFEAGSPHAIEITETLDTAYGSPNATILEIIVTDQPTLSPAVLDLPTVTTGTTTGNYTSGFTNIHASSTLTLTDTGGGPFEIVGSPGAWTLQNTADVNDPADTVYNIEVTETLAGAENTPLMTPLTITVLPAP